MTVALIAALAMVATDVLGTAMVMLEAANRGWGAGFLDAAQWGVGIATTTISVSALQGHNFELKVLVCVFVTIANVLGTKLGQMAGKRLLGSQRMHAMFAREGLTIEQRVEALERAQPHSHL